MLPGFRGRHVAPEELTVSAFDAPAGAPNPATSPAHSPNRDHLDGRVTVRTCSGTTLR
jgi:hypothetical protein